jgi:predicted nucleic acid-binding protein
VARDDRIRAQRLRTLSAVERSFDALPIDGDAARRFADLVADARRRGRRTKILDAFIAGTALARGLPVYTQDEDFDRFADVEVVRV